jgi:tetratricopeptide (TPR) repeat protein
MKSRLPLAVLVLSACLPGCSRNTDRQQADLHMTYFNEGAKQYESRRYSAAVESFGKSIEEKPDFPNGYLQRGRAFQELKEYAAAIADWERNIDLDPRRPHGHELLGWLYATCPDQSVRDGKKAIEHATKACELGGWAHPDHLSTLAAAYAEAGKFKDAVHWQTEALKMTGPLTPEAVEDMEQRLKLYEAGKPYHQP